MASSVQRQRTDRCGGGRVCPRVARPCLHAVEARRDRRSPLQGRPLARHGTGQLAEDAADLGRVPVAGGNHGIVGLHVAERLDVERCAARRHLVHDAGHARAVSGLQRHHGAAAALGRHGAVEAAAQGGIGHQLSGRRLDLHLQPAQVALHPRQLRYRVVLHRSVGSHHPPHLGGQRPQLRQLRVQGEQRGALDRIDDLGKRAADRFRRAREPSDGRQLGRIERWRPAAQAAERHCDLGQVQLRSAKARLQQAPQLHRGRPFGQHRLRVVVYTAGQHLTPSFLSRAVLGDPRQHAGQAEQRRGPLPAGREPIVRRCLSGHECARCRSRSSTSRSNRR